MTRLYVVLYVSIIRSLIQTYTLDLLESILNKNIFLTVVFMVIYQDQYSVEISIRFYSKSSCTATDRRSWVHRSSDRIRTYHWSVHFHRRRHAWYYSFPLLVVHQYFWIEFKPTPIHQILACTSSFISYLHRRYIIRL